MTVLRLRHLPDPVLREKTRRVTGVTPAIAALMDDMIETMYAEHGLGIAANQVGEKLRIAYIEIPEEQDEDGNVVQQYARHVLINPEIIRRVGEREVDEGCLSVPGWRGTLTRSVRVTVKARDLEGREVRIRAHGLLAQALEHETDHLNGISYIDRMESPDDLCGLPPAPRDDSEPSLAEPPADPPEPPDPQIVWRLRKPVAPVVRRG